MMKADANASAITTLQNTVKTQGDNIDSLSSSTTALENSLASSNASVDAASQIPGNLIVNPSFERGTEGYTGWSGIATVVTLQVPHLGTKAAKLAAGGSAGVGQKISFKRIGRTKLVSGQSRTLIPPFSRLTTQNSVWQKVTV